MHYRCRLQTCHDQVSAPQPTSDDIPQPSASPSARSLVRCATKPAETGSPFLAFPAPPLAQESLWSTVRTPRSEEHTSELQSRGHLVCRLLLEKKKRQIHSRQ